VGRAADLVIVGAGAAGSALAARLAQRGRDVLLLEAGGIDAPADVRDVASYAATLPGHPWNWAHPARLRIGTPEVAVPRGRGLGGSTAINGANWVRALPADAAGWDVPGWAWSELLPCYIRAEHDVDEPGPLHGHDGPVLVSRPAGELRHASVDAFLAAAGKLGFAAEPDKNAGGPPGAGLVPSNGVDGVRVDVATAYRQVGLPTIGTGAQVARVLIRRASVVGVELAGGEIIEAGEVVLAAGAVGTPLLLLRSGIGPADDLRAAGVPVVADLPVGLDFSDHPIVYLPVRDDFPPAHPHAPGSQVALDLDAGADPAGDVQVLQYVRPFVAGGDLHLMCALQHPDSRGAITLDPSGQPRIEYRYLRTEHDRRRLRHAVRTAAELLRAGLGTRTDPGGDVLGTDHALDGWIAAHLTTAVHLCGTAALGRVVAPDLRVLGVDGLRVADTSILPTVPRRGTAATAVAIGERAADLLSP
jgi:choline dehydrogenase